MKSSYFCFLFLASSFSNAEKLEYFESKIDFWGEKVSSKEINSSIKESNKMKESEKFPWKVYLDPSNREFFKEGDYTPPEPFMEVARNPSDENIKQWLELMNKKNEIQTKLQLRMQEYITKNTSLNQEVAQGLKSVPSSPKAIQKNEVRVDPARFRLRMYFESTCPHCRKMFGVLKRFQAQGFTVEALQVDQGLVPKEEKIIPIVKASSEELKKHNIKGVPFLLVADLERKVLLPAIQGFHDFDELLNLLKEASKN